MQLKFSGNHLIVTREPKDKKYYGVRQAKGESNLLYAIKQQLNKEGYDLIKTRMWKDGHMVDDIQQYLRTRKKGCSSRGDIYIYNAYWQIRGTEVDFNKGEVELEVVYDVWEKDEWEK